MDFREYTDAQLEKMAGEIAVHITELEAAFFGPDFHGRGDAWTPEIQEEREKLHAVIREYFRRKKVAEEHHAER